MKEFLRLILPEPAEVILFVAMGVILMLVQNVKRYIGMLDGENPDVVAQIGGIDQFFQNIVANTEAKIDPRVADMVIWMLIGALSFMLFSVIVASIKSYQNEHTLIEYYKSASGRHHEIIAYVSHVAVRVVGITGYLIWLVVFIKDINPLLTKQFFVATTSLTDPLSWLWVVLSVVLMAAALYLFAIFARLAVLKERVF
jgi:hypothetical protein